MFRNISNNWIQYLNMKYRKNERNFRTIQQFWTFAANTKKTRTSPKLRKT